MWTIRLKVDSPLVASLASALSTEENVTVSNSILNMTLCENRASDLRAIWNTRLRSLVMAEKVIGVVNKR